MKKKSFAKAKILSGIKNGLAELKVSQAAGGQLQTLRSFLREHATINQKRSPSTK